MGTGGPPHLVHEAVEGLPGVGAAAVAVLLAAQHERAARLQRRRLARLGLRMGAQALGMLLSEGCFNVSRVAACLRLQRLEKRGPSTPDLSWQCLRAWNTTSHVLKHAEVKTNQAPCTQAPHDQKTMLLGRMGTYRGSFHSRQDRETDHVRASTPGHCAHLRHEQPVLVQAGAPPRRGRPGHRDVVPRAVALHVADCRAVVVRRRAALALGVRPQVQELRACVRQGLPNLAFLNWPS